MICYLCNEEITKEQVEDRQVVIGNDEDYIPGLTHKICLEEARMEA